METSHREKLVEALSDYPGLDAELREEMEAMVRADIHTLEPLLDRMLLDARFEAYLEIAHAAQKNEVCRNCGARTIAVPF